MKTTLFFIAISVLLAVISCKSNSLSGVYICDGSKKKADTTIKHETYHESTFDLTCVVSELDFKGNSTVQIKVADAKITSTYIVDNKYVRIKGDKTEMSFNIVDGKTLKAEGFPERTYHKK